MKSEEMRGVFDRWRASGLSLLAFGKREEIGYSRLLYWRRKFKEEGASRDRLVDPVRVVPDPVPPEVAPEVVSVWLPNGVSLEVPLGLDGGELERLVQALSSC